MNIQILNVDYCNKKQATDLSYLLNEYAKDPMGGGQALPDNVLNNLAAELAKLPHALSVICYIDGKPAGLINAFEAFSTFSCKPLINIHDVVVLKEFRGNNLCQKMLLEIEAIAKNKGCCKLTLEVLTKNEAAKASYKKFGFSDFELDPAAGTAVFWQKTL